MCYAKYVTNDYIMQSNYMALLLYYQGRHYYLNRKYVGIRLENSWTWGHRRTFNIWTGTFKMYRNGIL